MGKNKQPHDFPNPFKYVEGSTFRPSTISIAGEISYIADKRRTRYLSIGTSKRATQASIQHPIKDYFQEARYHYRDGKLVQCAKFGYED